MKPQSSGAFLIKRPFDLQEAVVLLDVYLSMVKNGVPITMAAEKASVRLRNLAKSNGYIVSDSYRSSGGLFPEQILTPVPHTDRPDYGGG